VVTDATTAGAGRSTPPVARQHGEEIGEADSSVAIEIGGARGRSAWPPRRKDGENVVEIDIEIKVDVTGQARDLALGWERWELHAAKLKDFFNELATIVFLLAGDHISE